MISMASSSAKSSSRECHRNGLSAAARVQPLDQRCTSRYIQPHPSGRLPALSRLSVRCWIFSFRLLRDISLPQCFDFCADGQGIKTLEYLQDLVFRSSILFFLLIFSIYHIFYLSTPPFLIYTRISYELQDSTLAI